MTSIPDPRATPPVVVYDEPPVKPPPMLAVGPLAWVRDNLFGSAFDTILTIVAGTLLLSVSVGVLGWAIGAANWLVITRNLRLFMVGTYPVEELWRVNLAVLLCSFAIGLSVYAYVRVRLGLTILLGALVALIVVVPPLVAATVEPVVSYLAAGNVEIASGTATETPETDLAFVGRAGDPIRIGVADQASSDSALAQSAGFTDRASAALMNAARNRATAQAEIELLQARLESDLLTESQRAAVTEELNSLSVPPPVTETYTLNAPPVNVQVINAQTDEVIAEAQIEVGAPPLSLQLPEDGWYILRKAVADDGEGVTLLQATGIYPLIERNLTNRDEYIRVTDDFTVTEPRPQVDGDNVPMIVLTDNQYQGQRSFATYLRLSLAPFVELAGRALIPMTVLAVVGYGAGWGISRIAPRPRRASDRRSAVRSIVPWLWIVVLIWLSIVIYGVRGLDAAALGNLLARFIWVGWMFFAGVNLNRIWGRPLLALVVVLGLIQVSVAEGLTLDRILSAIQNTFAGIPSSSDLGGGIFGLLIWLVVGFFAARQGVAWRDKYSERNATLGAILAGALWLILFVAPPLLVNAAVSAESMTQVRAENLLPVVETRRWGGLLLTLVLTVVAILASFPLGVGLALGRRSTLPVVRWACTVYIELVRGVPFITVLFLGMLLVPLVNPALANVDNAVRAMVGTTLFSAAYLAENVRGGLQSIAPGQEEAARALGLNNLQVTMLITLPQALRAVIPALVGQCIALFKDTSLVALVGLTDLTGIAKSVIAQAEFVGLQTEVYVFISVIYFIFSYAMAYISRRIEASGSGAARRV